MFRGLMVGLIVSALAVSLSANALVDVSSSYLQGMVYDENDRPIVGASILLLIGGRPIGGGASDNFGRFKFTLPSNCDSLQIKVTSVGFEEFRRKLTSPDFTRALTIRCVPNAVELSPITVTPAPEPSQMKLVVPGRQIVSLASRSLVVTNPTAAIQYPQIARIGSAHSTQIRINGTSPIFHLNGIPIGTDPNHFGMFSVVPATIVEQIDFRPQGTDASFGLPSVIDFRTITAFENRSSTELNFSTLEVTGTVRKSTPSRYLIGAARKSILDHIVNSLDLSTKQATIPPTSFSDLFLTVGTKITPHWQLGLDQYHVRDYLAFNTGSSGDMGPAVQTYQRTREHYVGLRMNGLYGGSLFSTTLAVRSGERSYEARPEEQKSSNSVHINLHEEMTTYLGQVSAEVELGSWQIKGGGSIEAAPHRDMQLDQNNWNFLPPFTTSDNPYIYQVALNRQYADVNQRTAEETRSTYLSLSKRMGRLTLKGGARAESFSHLKGNAVNGRFSATLRTGNHSNATIFYGGFAEDPVTSILEPYQVMIRDQAHRLEPINTDLVAFDYTLGPAKLSLFHKTLSGVPVIAPDFDHVKLPNGQYNPDFLLMESSGSVRFAGGSIAFDIPHLSNRLSFYGSYAYTNAERTEHGVTYPYEANAQHRLQTQVEYKMSRKVKIGTELFVRSGYNYSPNRQVMSYSESDKYTEDYYRSVLAQENSLSFPTNAALNLYANFSLGNATLNLAITNATNRYNPIIRSDSGYIYDAGILPSIGLRWQL